MGSSSLAPPPPSASARRAVVNPVSLVVLLAADLLPLVGVLFLGWQVFPIILLYWSENVVIGAFTVVKIGKAQGEARAVVPPARVRVRMRIGNRSVDAASMSKAQLQSFFCLHYGLFTVVHGVLVFVVFGPSGAYLGGIGSGGLGVGLQWWFWLSVLSLVVSHGVSYRRNFVAAGEYLALSPQEVMAQPYGRVVVLHITVLGAGVLVVMMGAPLAGLLVLVGLKTALDVYTFVREHRKAAQKAARYL